MRAHLGRLKVIKEYKITLFYFLWNPKFVAVMLKMILGTWIGFNFCFKK